ncbi:hypothetical protein K491DRAFT_520526 [Lophiostoma macrostomum CBS 122681]|uniref:Uncharacterized protein n=1 Tax=Lophiostoma macrostomum CBS 122681 TaxID=1314788 RepID=A0A6A6T023_9PLEO|nr:hypothetical protein K491DRAFT_520526 [Lophiostoma macrostomum CBS 122681]
MSLAMRKASGATTSRISTERLWRMFLVLRSSGKRWEWTTKGAGTGAKVTRVTARPMGNMKWEGKKANKRSRGPALRRWLWQHSCVMHIIYLCTASQSYANLRHLHDVRTTTLGIDVADDR